jgi:hypothetical protein
MERSNELEINVLEMGELLTLVPDVNLVFDNAEDYKNGVYEDVSNQLKLSITTPYDLYVRAENPNFSSSTGNFPCNVMRIGPGPGETGIETITLSTSHQKLINQANPTIDRPISLRYSIPQTETHKLLEKPKAVYSNTIIFSFTAL